MDMFQIVRLHETDDFYLHIDHVDINLVNEYGQNLLHEAIAYGRNDLAEELIRAGIDVNHRSSDGRTPLHTAAWYQNRELTGLILASGGNVSVKDVDGNTPLWAAVINPRRDYRVVELLVEHSADPCDKNNYGKSPLDVATEVNETSLLACSPSVMVHVRVKGLLFLSWCPGVVGRVSWASDL